MWNLIPFPLNLSWPQWLAWPIECGKNEILGFPRPGHRKLCNCYPASWKFFLVAPSHLGRSLTSLRPWCWTGHVYRCSNQHAQLSPIYQPRHQKCKWRHLVPSILVYPPAEFHKVTSADSTWNRRIAQLSLCLNFYPTKSRDILSHWILGQFAVIDTQS